MEKKAQIGIQVFITKRREYWVAYCPALKTFGYSNVSQEKALKDLDDAIKTFFQVHQELGTLNKTLLNFGWQRADHSFKIPTINTDIAPYRGDSSKTTRQINVPAYC